MGLGIMVILRRPIIVSVRLGEPGWHLTYEDTLCAGIDKTSKPFLNRETFWIRLGLS